MADFDNIPAALNALRKFEIEHWASLPDEIKEMLDRTAASASPVDRIVFAGEAIYAHGDKIKAKGARDAAKDVAIGLVGVASNNGWHDANKNGRAAKIKKVLAGQSVADAPAPRAEVMPPPAEPIKTETPNI